MQDTINVETSWQSFALTEGRTAGPQNHPFRVSDTPRNGHVAIVFDRHNDCCLLRVPGYLGTPTVVQRLPTTMLGLVVWQSSIKVQRGEVAGEDL
jgi:hypothetical protein